MMETKIEYCPHCLKTQTVNLVEVLDATVVECSICGKSIRMELKLKRSK